MVPPQQVQMMNPAMMGRAQAPMGASSGGASNFTLSLNQNMAMAQNMVGAPPLALGGLKNRIGALPDQGMRGGGTAFGPGGSVGHGQRVGVSLTGPAGAASSSVSAVAQGQGYARALGTSASGNPGAYMLPVGGVPVGGRGVPVSSGGVGTLAMAQGPADGAMLSAGPAGAAAVVAAAAAGAARGPHALAEQVGATRAVGAIFPGGAAAEAQQAPQPAKEAVSIPPGFTPDAVQRVSLRPLLSTHEWSDKLRADGKPVTWDTATYEELIKKDELYLRRLAIQTHRTRGLLERMARDMKTYAGIKQLRMSAISASAKNQFNNSIWGEGYQGYGNGISNTATQVVLPHQNKLFTKVPDLPYTDKQISAQIRLQLRKQLVPVRLDFDLERDRFKLRDTFVWDAADPLYPLELFVKTLVEDYKFIPDQSHHAVMAAIAEQIKEFRSLPDQVMGELRVPIKIDMVCNNKQFKDQFEWDILNYSETDPEEFATILCDEMGLPGEFTTTIAFEIREQTLLYHKALYMVGYAFDGSAIREDEIRANLLPALRAYNSEAGVEDFVSTLRNPAIINDFSPSIVQLAQSEAEKYDKEMERESRRRRRHTNSENFSYNENGPNSFGSGGRGTASRRSALHSGRAKSTIPDLSDNPKNFRTPVPSSVLPGGIELGVPEIYGYNELIVNRTQIKNSDYKAPAPPGTVTSFRDSTGSFYVKIRLPRRDFYQQATATNFNV